ncbi:MAG: N-formylglutamate amidohydrolase [Burkholderiales bacterium]
MNSITQHEGVDVALGTTALVLDSPHSGTTYPEDFGHSCQQRALRGAEDTYVEELWGFAPGMGASLVHARFPRSYVDVNRAVDEIDETLLNAPWPGPVSGGAKVRLGKGLVWRMLDDGTPIYDRQLTVEEVQQRIDRCWFPYHLALDQAVHSARERRGFVIHINCHSMPAVAQAYSTDHPWLVHADFVLGDRDGTSADPGLTHWIERFLNSRGHTVSVNHPYKGVEIVRKHGKPFEQQHSIQLEINKRLYMDEVTLERNAGFAPLQNTLRELTQALLRLDTRAATYED